MKINLLYLVKKGIYFGLLNSIWLVSFQIHAAESVKTATDDDLTGFLNRFYERPENALNETPQKFIPISGEMLSATNSREDHSATREESFAEHDRQRLEIMTGSTDGGPHTFSPFLGNDRVETIVDGEVIRSIRTLENFGYLSGRAAVMPWGDNYWPIIKGGISNRYADPRFPKASHWETNYEYVRSRDASQILSSRNWMNIVNLSPAEKYDIIVGDQDFGLSRWAWNQGKNTFDDRGFVPGWMGICHGWSIASLLTPAPQKFVDVPAAHNGVNIRFYLSDMKALMSALWARAMPRSKFIGGRCRTTNPARDSRGRISDPNCFDVNPGTWHMVVTNQLGRNRKGFVIDATFDYEVWNQPLVSYSYRYFNPQTKVSGNRFDQSVISISQFTNDKFRSYRSANTRKIVGINMQVTYAAEMVPNHNYRHANPPLRTVNYVYDLELDANDQILGGEWYQNAHPDFLWSINEGTLPVTAGDALVPPNEIWVGNAPLSSTWLEAARAASARGQPLTKIVYALFAQAHNFSEIGGL